MRLFVCLGGKLKEKKGNEQYETFVLKSLIGKLHSLIQIRK